MPPTSAASSDQPPANTDARALGRYLSAIGLGVTAERLNDILTLLAVVMIEAGGGVCRPASLSDG